MSGQRGGKNVRLYCPWEARRGCLRKLQIDPPMPLWTPPTFSGQDQG